jgi:hypothetical protein
VFAIGPMVSFGRPEPQIDRASNLHVMHQDGASSFSYTVFNSQGDLLTRQTYDYIESRPRLRLDDDGNVSVVGGTRRVAANDFPAAKQEESDDVFVPGPTGLQSIAPTNTISANKPAR